MRRLVVALALILGFTAVPVAVHAAPLPLEVMAAKTCKSSFLGFPAWYDGLVNSSDCSLKSPSSLGAPANTQLSRYIWIIALNILQIMLMAVLYVSVGFVIYGGFLYMTSTGDSGRVASGKKTVLNAIIGLVLSFMSIAIVNLIAGNIKT